MNLNLRKLKTSIWGLAFGYFAFYVPYSAITKALSKGLIPGADPISGFEFLPAVVVGTNLLLLVAISMMGWWKYAGTRRVLGVNVPFATNKWTIFSGIGTGLIILTTTLAYSFEGISIVFAALLMRGGVLILSPVIDTLFKRKVHWNSWVALGLSLCALLLLFAEKGGYTLTLIAGLNIGLYLAGYVFRLQYMTRIAKSTSQETNYRFFVEEMLVAMVAIMILPFLFPLIGYGNGISDLVNVGTVFTNPNVLLPALLIGALYGCLYLFGTRIYLNRRENTFCIPINRCASLLAGVVASLALGWIMGDEFVTPFQLASAGILMVAILFLAVPALIKLLGWSSKNEQSPLLLQYVFVCPGNTSRSPMAMAICADKIETRLRVAGLDMRSAGIEVVSAGIDPKVGAALSEDARATLHILEIDPPNHVATRLSLDHIRNATAIFCMSEAHKQIVIDRFPEASLKCHCLDPGDNLPNPHGMGLTAYRECADFLSEMINLQLEDQRISLG